MTRRPPTPSSRRAGIARGEAASFQLVVRCEAPLEKLRATCTPFAPMAQTAPSQSRLGSDAAAATQPARLEFGAVRFVGYVPVDRPVQTPAADLLRKPPAEYPDPLLEVESVDVPAGAAQPIWVTVPIPATASRTTSCCACWPSATRSRPRPSPSGTCSISTNTTAT